MASARFLLRPRWLLSHVLVALLVVTMISLGFWQLRRLDEKRDRNALVEARWDEPVVPVQDLLAPGATEGDVDAARYRRVTASGTYEDEATVTVRNRTQDGAAGAWLVTPLEVGSGERVGVIRGFVGLTADGSAADAPAPEGEVTVTGQVVAPDRLDGTAPDDVAPLLAEGGVLGGLVLAEGSDPPEPNGAEAGGGAGADSILTVPPPELGEGPHLSYAVQWFIFTTIAIVGYPLVLRRVVQRRGKEVDDDADRGPDELAHQGG